MNNDLLLTDFYQLTMLQAYHHERMQKTAVFELFVRRLPANRQFLLAAGLEQALSFLEQAHFSDDNRQWLRATGRFSAQFIDELKDFRFTGDVDAVPEGTVIFPLEPILRIRAPLPQAQLVESRLINLINFQTMIASKAARCRLACPPPKLLLDFGLRRAHGAESGLLSARAAWLAGFDATATAAASAQFDIPFSGTMAHAYVQAHDSEQQAFAQFAEVFGEHSVLLLDTYDTSRGLERAITVADQLRQQGKKLLGVRLDSGDLAAGAKSTRQRLDQAGHSQVKIFVSGDLDEDKLQILQDSPIDGFGVGTRLNTSSDAPSLDTVYKLQEYDGQPKCKIAVGKNTYPGSKQILRHYQDSIMIRDTLTLHNALGNDEGLLQPVMRGGKRIHSPVTLATSRQYTQQQLNALPSELANLKANAEYPVAIAAELQQLTQQVIANVR